MMANFYVLLYRTYLVLKKSATEGGLRRLPRIGRGLDQFKRRIDRRFLPEAQAWVRIQSGLSTGMWMHLHFPRFRYQIKSFSIQVDLTSHDPLQRLQ